MNSWTFRFLTKGGKKLTSAMAAHVMSCFRLTKMVMKTLMSIIEKFWWRSRGNVKGMYGIHMKKCAEIKKMGD